MISREEVQKLAELARLQLADAEVESLQKDISNILDYVGQVSSVEGSGEKVTPLHHNAMRDDVPHADGAVMQGKREALVAAFPMSEKGYNVVRKIIQKDE